MGRAGATLQNMPARLSCRAMVPGLCRLADTACEAFSLLPVQCLESLPYLEVHLPAHLHDEYSLLSLIHI